MMGRIIKSRRFERLTGFAISLAMAVVATASVAATSTLPRLPVIQNVGAIPVQWENADGYMPGRQNLEAAFAKAVRNAHRFRVLNDDLVAGLWNDPNGRAELRNQFELQAFVSLTVAPRGDTLALTSRLLDASLKTELLEEDTITADWLANAEAKAIDDRIADLIFRMFNRIPVDVSVTSVQGPYITLSGGSEQGVEPGDKVAVVRASIRALHPANGSWLEFQQQSLGTAQVVEVKNYTSVAKITAQTYENAIQVGDGAHVAQLASRVRFARLEAKNGFKDSGDQATIIVPPLYNGPPPDNKAPAPKPVTPAPAAPQPAAAAETAQATPAPAPEPAPAPASQPAAPQDQPPAEQQDSGPSAWDDMLSDASSHRLIDEINIYGGPFWWSFSGGSDSVPDASGKFPAWLINSIGAGVTHTLLYKIKTAFGAGVVFGKVGDGNYYGYDTYARIYWEDELNLLDGFVTGWRAGGAATFSGLGTDHSRYGGGDWIRGGGFGGLYGTTHIGVDHTRYDWFGNFTLMPLNIGRVGYDGKQYTTESAFGWRIAVGAFKFQPARVIEWGGGIEMATDDETLRNGEQPEIVEYSIKVLARYAL